MLKSLLTGQCVDIAGEEKEEGSKVVQWDETGGSNQLWRPEPAGQGVVRIQSIHAPGMYLCIRDDDVNDNGKLEIGQGNRQSSYWRVEGHCPH